MSTLAIVLPTTVGWGATAALVIAFGFLIFTLVAGNREEPATLEDHMNSYGPKRRMPTRKLERASFADQAREIAQQALANNKGLEARIEARLESSGLALRPAEWLLLHGAIVIVAGFLGLFLGSGNPLLIVLMAAAGAFVPWLYLGFRRNRRLKAFDSGLADTLQLISGSLSAGLSLAQSLDTVVREGAEPIAGEFRRAIVEARLGVELEDALDGIAERMQSKDFGWVVMAIRIQRQVGGNLAELLQTVAGTLREREYLRRHVLALSAEGRLSCWVLGGLPPAFLAYLALSKPDYVHPMFTTTLGWLLCGAMAVLLSVGIFWMTKVSKVAL